MKFDGLETSVRHIADYSTRQTNGRFCMRTQCQLPVSQNTRFLIVLSIVVRPDVLCVQFGVL